MSGLSDASLRRLAELEAKATLESYNRGELRAMVHSRPSPEQAERLRRLLEGGSDVEVSEAFLRGMERAGVSTDASRRHS